MTDMFDLIEEVKPVGKYGISYLDNQLRSINKGELVLIGACSGAGKSTLAQKIAVTNSKNKVKTALFSLENSRGDTLRREVYNVYRNISKNWKMTYREFIEMVNSGLHDGECLEEAYRMAGETLKDVWLYEKPTEGFTVQNLKEEFEKAVKDGCKLLIIDHLDYFDQIDNDPKDECKYLREIMKSIRKLIEEFGTPVVAFSQFRKPTDQKMIIPTQYEFYGSSDKAKIATTIITLARNFDDKGMSPTDIHTYIAIRKDRFGNTSVADCVFDLKSNEYKTGYTLGYTNEWGHFFKEI